MDQHLTGPAESYYCYPRSASFSEFFESYPWPTMKGKYPVLRIYTKSHQLNQAWNFFFYSFTCVSQIFLRTLPKWSKIRYLKAEALQMLQKIQTVQYLLLVIHILVSFITRCGTSKIYSCLEDNISSFSRVHLKPENKDGRP